MCAKNCFGNEPDTPQKISERTQMTQRENLPAAMAAQVVSVLPDQRVSLVGRGLAALRKGSDTFNDVVKAAERGNAEKQWRLGYMYEIGNGVDRNDEQAVYWYRKSAA